MSLNDVFARGKADPAFFVEHVIGLTSPWSKQKEIMASVRDNKHTTVRSCNGAGKTFVSAQIVAWFLSSHPNSYVITTAPTARQVRELLWQEVRYVHANSKIPLGGDCTQVTWRIAEKWQAMGLSTDEPDRFQGFHAEYILGVIDEAAGVEAPIFEGMDAILTSEGARLLLIGNPTEASGRFYDSFGSSLYHKVHISAFDTPNFTENGITLDDIRNNTWKPKIKQLRYPALITPAWVHERYTDWGEDSPAFHSRILGVFPTIGTDTMLPLGWVMRAKERGIVPWTDKDVCVVSVDVARFGDDESVIGIRRGQNYLSEQAIAKQDVVQIADATEAVILREKPNFIVVDAVGIGAGVADILRSRGYTVIDFVSQSRAWDDKKFINKRVEAWFKVRELLRKDQIVIPPNDLLVGQLTSPKYRFDTQGKYVLESKEDMKKRGLSSPDRADALIMAFWLDEAHGPVDTEEFDTQKPAPPGTVAHILERLEAEAREDLVVCYNPYYL